MKANWFRIKEYLFDDVKHQRDFSSLNLSKYFYWATSFTIVKCIKSSQSFRFLGKWGPLNNSLFVQNSRFSSVKPIFRFFRNLFLVFPLRPANELTLPEAGLILLSSKRIESKWERWHDKAFEIKIKSITKLSKSRYLATESFFS